MYEILHKLCQLCSFNLTFGLKVQLVCVNMKLVSWHIGSSWLTALRLFWFCFSSESLWKSSRRKVVGRVSGRCMGGFALPTAVDGCLFAALNSRKKKSEEFAEKIYWHPTLFFPSLKQSAFWPLFWFRSKNAISHVATSWEKTKQKMS